MRYSIRAAANPRSPSRQPYAGKTGLRMQVKAPRDGYVTVFPCRDGTYMVKCFYHEPLHVHAGGPMAVVGDALVCDILNMTAQQIRELCGREPRWTLNPKKKKK